MDSTSLATSAKPRFDARSLGRIRLIPQIDKSPRIVAFAQTPAGKVALLALFGLGLRYFYPSAPSVLVMVVPLTFITLMPEYRRFVLAIAPIAFAILGHLGSPLDLGTTVAAIALGLTLYRCAMRWPASRFGRRPVAHMLLGVTLLIAGASMAPAHSLAESILWSAVGAMTSYLWFICYALVDRASQPKRDFALELATFRPLWGSTNTPFPKGAAYLRRIEAKDPEQLAVSQLKGLKLLAWAIVLAVLEQKWHWFFHGHLGIPYPVQAIALTVKGTPAAWHVRWESQVLFFFEATLSFAVMGHKFISICRMAGFNALRNSYRPLSSTTIAEFFNRFYYYFKELLVDFFFYPTFLRYFKQHRRLRTFFATFIAIALGNSVYHLIRDWHFFQDEGLGKGLAGFQVQFFYNLLMATAVGISQLRKRSSKSTNFLRRRIAEPGGVLMFYCVLGVFGDESRRFTLWTTLKYLASLLFIHI